MEKQKPSTQRKEPTQRVGAGQRRMLFACCLFLSAWLATFQAFAQPPASGASNTCSDTVLAALSQRSQADPDVATGSNMPPAPVAQVCKAWPFDPTITLAAVVWSRSSEQAGPGERNLDLVVAMLSFTSTVLAMHRRPLEEDALLAVTDSALRFDTARYDLAPGQRAFGVVLSSSAPGPSCPDRRFEDELTLYVREGAVLKPVLATYLHATDFVKGGPCSQDASRVTDNADITLHIQPTRSDGLADIRLHAAVLRERSDGSDAPAIEERRTADRVLRFDGATYQADPFDKLFFWAAEGRRD